jgi:hypothetical protein
MPPAVVVTLVTVGIGGGDRWYDSGADRNPGVFRSY